MSEPPSPWMVSRLEGVPADFLPWLGVEPGVRGGDEAEAGIGADAPTSAAAANRAADLESRGVAALRRATATPGRVRESAFHLLAADAFLTWSAEALLDHPDPPKALAALLRRVAAEDE